MKIPRGELLGIARRSRPRLPMEQLESAEVTTDSGVEGDCRGRPGPRQVTVISEEAWQASNMELGLDLPWILRRANLYLRGVDLRNSVGAFLRIGEVLLEVSEDNPPCRVMDLQHQGLRSSLKPDQRGGVACCVIQGGKVRVGDRAEIERPAAITTRS